MILYFEAEAQHKIYKLSTESDVIWLYWVMIHRLGDGSFQHGRGRDRMQSWDTGLHVCSIMCTPSTASAYNLLLNRYLLTDQSLRKQIIPE